jgi:kanamycin kinase
MDVAVPSAVVELTAGRPLRPVWQNQLGGLTFEVGSGPDRCFVKWAAASTGLDLEVEAERMRWLAPLSPAPEVLGAGHVVDGDPAETGSWLMTQPLPGDSAVSERWKADPAVAVEAIAAGLRHLHDHAPIERCPFTWRAEDRVVVARARADAGLSVPSRWHPDHQALSLDEALAAAGDIPSIDRLVVCHGDACAPNTLIDHGRFAGHVDLGALGVADRWADLAVATWSLDWNYGSGWEPAFYSAYEVDPDPARVAYYRLLWDLT